MATASSAKRAGAMENIVGIFNDEGGRGSLRNEDLQ